MSRSRGANSVPVVDCFVDGLDLADLGHAGGKNGDMKTVVASTYVVEKGKPLASPA